MFVDRYPKAVLVVLIPALALIVLNRPSAFAQTSLDTFNTLSPEQKFYYVSGYLDGFALAAQLPQEHAARLQQCFAEFGTTKTVRLFETWITKNPEKTRQQGMTIRTGLFAALAEACGWTRQ